MHVFECRINCSLSLDFELAGFGERQASIVNGAVVRCEPWTCAAALSNAAALKGARIEHFSYVGKYQSCMVWF